MSRSWCSPPCGRGWLLCAPTFPLPVGVDPGGWLRVRSDQLIVPLDVHMRRICSTLGLTHRKSADLKTAIEATEAFRALCPEGPVRYDLALTRLSLHAGPPALRPPPVQAPRS